MAVPDYVRFFYLGGLHAHVHCVHEKINLHHSGTQSFLGNVDTFLDLKIRQLHSPRGVSDVEP